MTQEDLKQLREYAKKVACIFYEKAIIAFQEPSETAPIPKSMLHLPFGSAKKIKSLTSEEFSNLFDEVSKKTGPVRISRQITTDELFAKRLQDSSQEQLLQVAFEAHECCKNQDIHLHLFRRLMMENGLSIRQIKNWKLPDSNVMDGYFDKMLSHLESLYEELKKKHEVKNLHDDEQSPYSTPLQP